MDHRIRPGSRVTLARIDTRVTGKHADEAAARAELVRGQERLVKVQDAFYAEHRRALLVVLQGMDASGKDGTVKHVMTGVNPSGCEVVPFKAPTDDEAAHDFLWRVHRATPRRGHITIFNRSHYEDVLVPRVHRTVPRKHLRPRYDHINAFERLHADEGTVVLKFFLHVSKAEQRRRMRERLCDPTKNWKFSEHDLAERKLWGRYQEAYEKLLSRCSTAHAPWYVIPADQKWYRNLAVARVIVDTLEGLRPRYPRPILPRGILARLSR